MTASRTRNAALGFSTDLGGTLLLTALQFLIIPVYLLFISGDQYGFWLTFLSMLTWLGLCDMGLGVSLMRLVSAADNDEKLSQLASSAFCLFLLAGLLVMLVGFGLQPLLVGWFDIPANQLQALNSMFQLLIVIFALSLPLSVFGEVLNGLEQMYFVNLVNTVATLAGMALTLLALWKNMGVLAFALGHLARTLVAVCSNAVYLRYKKPQVRCCRLAVSRVDLKRLLGFGGYFQIGRFANTVATSTDNVIIASYMGGAAVSTYNFTSKLAVMVSQSIASKLPNATMPGMSGLFNENRLEVLRGVFLKLTAYATRLGVLSALFLVLANQTFVNLWVGSDYYGGLLLSLVFVYWAFQDSIYRGTSGVLFASGEIKGWTFVSGIEAILNLGLSLALVRPFGLVGVAIATSIARTLTTAWYTPLVICRTLEMPFARFALEGGLKTIAKCIPSCLVMCFFAWVAPAEWGWFWLILVGISGVLCNLLTFDYDLIRQWVHRRSIGHDGM